MNRALRAFIHFCLAKVIEASDRSDYIMRPEEVEKKVRESRTQWGGS